MASNVTHLCYYNQKIIFIDFFKCQTNSEVFAKIVKIYLWP